MARNQTVREALAAQIAAAITTINVTAYGDDGTKLPRVSIFDEPDSVDYVSDYGAAWKTLRYRLVIEVSGTQPATIIQRLDELMSWDHTDSVYAAVYADRTLGLGDNIVKSTSIVAGERFPEEPGRGEIPVQITAAT